MTQKIFTSIRTNAKQGASRSTFVSIVFHTYNCGNLSHTSTTSHNRLLWICTS